MPIEKQIKHDKMYNVSLIYTDILHIYFTFFFANN